MPPFWFYDLMYRWRAPWEVSARSELVALVGFGRVTPERLAPGQRSTSAAGRVSTPSSRPRLASTSWGSTSRRSPLERRDGHRSPPVCPSVGLALQSVCTVAVLLTSSGTGSTPALILAVSERVGVPAKALLASPKETR